MQVSALARLSRFCFGSGVNVQLQGNQDAVYSVENASQEIQLFVNSPDAQLVVVDGGAHLLNATHPGEVNGALVDFVKRQGL